MNVTERIENDLYRAWVSEWNLKRENRELEMALYKISLCSDPTAQQLQPINELMAAIHKYARAALGEGKE
jgi:hypothetical protein